MFGIIFDSLWEPKVLCDFELFTIQGFQDITQPLERPIHQLWAAVTPLFSHVRVEKLGPRDQQRNEGREPA